MFRVRSSMDDKVSGINQSENDKEEEQKQRIAMDPDSDLMQVSVQFFG